MWYTISGFRSQVLRYVHHNMEPGGDPSTPRVLPSCYRPEGPRHSKANCGRLWNEHSTQVWSFLKRFGLYQPLVPSSTIVNQLFMSEPLSEF